MTTTYTTALDSLVNLGGPTIPEVQTADPRFPFLMLIDISGSTASRRLGMPDIDRINEAMLQLVQKLKYPQSSGPLAQVQDQIDIAVVAYSNEPIVVQDWIPAALLPDQLPLFTAGGGTSMGKALNTALDMVLARQRRYKAQGLPKCGLPHIFHLTDGEPTDIKIGDALWQDIERKIVHAANDPKKKSLVVHNFITPNGFATGSGAGSGAALIMQWFGAKSVVPLADGTDKFQNLVEVIVKTITVLSESSANAEVALETLFKDVRDAA